MSQPITMAQVRFLLHEHGRNSALRLYASMIDDGGSYPVLFAGDTELVLLIDGRRVTVRPTQLRKLWF